MATLGHRHRRPCTLFPTGVETQSRKQVDSIGELKTCSQLDPAPTTSTTQHASRCPRGATLPRRDVIIASTAARSRVGLPLRTRARSACRTRSPARGPPRGQMKSANGRPHGACSPARPLRDGPVRQRRWRPELGYGPAKRPGILGSSLVRSAPEAGQGPCNPGLGTLRARRPGCSGWRRPGCSGWSPPGRWAKPSRRGRGPAGGAAAPGRRGPRPSSCRSSRRTRRFRGGAWCRKSTCRCALVSRRFCDVALCSS